MTRTWKRWFATSRCAQRRLEVEALEDRCIPTAGTTFVPSLYADFLGRPASAGEVQYWDSLLPTLGAGGVATGVIRSTEALTHAVDGFYVALLNRQAQGGEENGWVSSLQNGSTEEQVAAGILASPEFAGDVNQVGVDTNASYVAALYPVLLGRTGSTAEINGWLSALPNLGRVGVALGFLTAAEFRADVVEQLYGFSGEQLAASPSTQRLPLPAYFPPLMGRTTAPTQAEVNAWVFSGLDVLTIQVAFGASPEYVQGTGTIRGQVTDNSTGLGLAGVTVQATDASGTVLQTTTDAGGNYSFAGLASGPYVVHAVAPTGYVQTSPTFTQAGPMPAGNGGPFQSPINLTGPTADLSQVLQINYAPTLAPTTVETVHDIQINPSSTSSDSITVGGATFKLAQFHFHEPAETTVNGQADTMELHFVNKNSAGAISVVGVFLQLGAHNNALDPILATATANLITGTTDSALSTPIDVSGLLPASMQGWYYQGSLTTFPFSGPINWFVLSTPITLDSGQLAQYEAVAQGFGFLPNARAVQPSDGRQLNQIDNNENLRGHATATAGFVFQAAP